MYHGYKSDSVAACSCILCGILRIKFMPVPTLLVLLGPTAVGKTKLSISLAQHFNTAIVNADSRQIYRGMEIGTAAPTRVEREQAEHYFVGFLAPDQYYSAARYEEEATSLLEALFQHHEVLLLSGGSMLYLDAVCNGIDEIPTVDDEVRSTLKQRLQDEGLDSLLAELRLLDPDYYNNCDLRNTRRIVHALEVCYISGQPYSSFRTGKKAQRPFRIIKIGLQRERNELFGRINRRVTQMMDTGLADETRRLIPYRHCNALNTVGYKETFRYLDGDWTMEQTIEKIARNTRVYAKKQMTWFQRDDEIKWFHPDETQDIIRHIDTSLS